MAGDKRARGTEAEHHGMTPHGYQAWVRLCAQRHRVPCKEGGDAQGCCVSRASRARMEQFISSMIEGQQIVGRGGQRALMAMRSAARRAVTIARAELKDKVQGKIEDVIKDQIIKGKLWEDTSVRWVRGHMNANTLNAREFRPAAFVVDLSRLARMVTDNEEFSDRVFEEAVREAPNAPLRPTPFSRSAIMNVGDTQKTLSFDDE